MANHLAAASFHRERCSKKTPVTTSPLRAATMRYIIPPPPVPSRPGIVGMRGSMVVRLRPCMIPSTHPPWCKKRPAWSVKIRRAPSWYCRDARVNGHTNTAMHDFEYTRPPPPAPISSHKIAPLRSCHQTPKSQQARDLSLPTDTYLYVEAW